MTNKIQFFYLSVPSIGSARNQLDSARLSEYYAPISLLATLQSRHAVFALGGTSAEDRMTVRYPFPLLMKAIAPVCL